MMKLPERIPIEGLSRVEITDRAYDIFWNDFIMDPDPVVEGKPVRLKHGWWENRELTFWHLVSNASDFVSHGVSRTRCSYVPWVKVILDNYQDGYYWRNKRKKAESLCIVDANWQMVVVLRERKGDGYWLLWTAYPLARHRQEKLRCEHEEYWAQMKEAENAKR